MDQNILFSESQRFTQWWLYLIMILASLLVIGGLIFTRLMNLETEIRKDGIYVRYYPLKGKFRHYPWSQLTKTYIRQYSPISEYGGWGLKGSSDNKAWNVSGNVGLQLVTSDGKKLLIGTRKPEEIKAALMRLNQYKE